MDLHTASYHCNNLVEQGIREYANNYSSLSDYNLVRNQVKEIYDEYKRSKNTASASAKYKVLFKGSANYSKEDIESIYKLYWSENLNIKRL